MRKVLLFIILIILSACNLSSSRGDNDPIVTPSAQASGKPTVTISSPKEGDEVVVGRDVFVSANASDSEGVTRVQLVVNNQIVKTVSSESASGDKTMSVLLDFKPNTQGQTKLEVIAYRRNVASDPAVVNIVVRASQAQVTETIVPQTGIPTINPNDPTCRALVNTGLNMRTGPNTNFNRITVIGAGVVVPIVGRTGSNDWWQVSYSGNIGWIAAPFTTVYGICTAIPITYQPPAPPTATRFIPPPTITPPLQPTVTPGPADLVIISIAGAEDLTIPASEGSVSANYAVTVTNTGSRRTGTFIVAVSITPSGPLVEASSVSDLAPGQSISLDFPVVFDAAGSYTFRATADNDNVVAEVSEVNNVGVIGIDVVVGS
jgi:hypothetical protein